MDMVRICALIFLGWTYSVASSQAATCPPNPGPAPRHVSGPDAIVMSGGTLSPVYEAGDRCTYIPDGYTPSNSYCFAVFFQINNRINPGGGDNFDITAEENQWRVQTGNSRPDGTPSKSLAHIRCWRPNIQKSDPVVIVRYSDSSSNQEFLRTLLCKSGVCGTNTFKSDFEKACKNIGLSEPIAVGPPVPIEVNTVHRQYASWVACR